MGFKQSNVDHTLFFKHNHDKVIVLIVYVDDIVITGNDDGEIAQLKKALSRSFEVKDLGTISLVLKLHMVFKVFISHKGNMW
jgi:hypothetical protein